MHPEFIQTTYFTINTLWVFSAAALVLATYTLIKLSEKNGLKIQFLSENSWKLILWTLVGARIFAIIQNYETYFYELNKSTLFNLFYIWDKGLSLSGAIAGFLIYLYLSCKKNNQDFLKWLDVIVPSTIIGLAIVHIGAFFEGINYGRETSLPWGVNFESPSIKYTVPIHPTQIYAFIYSLIISSILILISRTEKIISLEKSGFIGLLGIVAYSFFNFLEEFVRGDDTFLIFGIRVPQIIAFIITIATGIYLYLRYKENAKKFIKNKKGQLHSIRQKISLKKRF